MNHAARRLRTRYRQCDPACACFCSTSASLGSARPRSTAVACRPWRSSVSSRPDSRWRLPRPGLRAPGQRASAMARRLGGTKAATDMPTTRVLLDRFDDRTWCCGGNCGWERRRVRCRAGVAALQRGLRRVLGQRAVAATRAARRADPWDGQGRDRLVPPLAATRRPSRPARSRAAKETRTSAAKRKRDGAEAVRNDRRSSNASTGRRPWSWNRPPTSFRPPVMSASNEGQCKGYKSTYGAERSCTSTWADGPAGRSVAAGRLRPRHARQPSRHSAGARVVPGRQRTLSAVPTWGWTPGRTRPEPDRRPAQARRHALDTSRCQRHHPPAATSGRWRREREPKPGALISQ